MNLHDSRSRRPRSAIGVLTALCFGLTVTLARPAAPAIGQSLQSFPATVVAVLAADRLEVELAGVGRDRVRLNGIEIPDCIEREAHARTTRLTMSKVVYVEPSSRGDDSNGDLWGYIWANDSLVNVILVAEGLAVPSDVANRYSKTLTSAMNEARTYKRGGWDGSCFR